MKYNVDKGLLEQGLNKTNIVREIFLKVLFYNKKILLILYVSFFAIKKCWEN